MTDTGADWGDDDENAFQSRHTEFVKLYGHPTVTNVAARFAAGLLDMRGFLAELFSIPEVSAAIGTLTGAAGTTAGALVGAASGPLGALAGPAAGALVTLGLNALARVLKASPSAGALSAAGQKGTVHMP